MTNEDGFTLPELITVMIVSLLFALLIFFFAFNFWRSAAFEQADQDTLISRLNAGDFIRQNIGESAGLIIQNGLPDSHVLVPDPTQASGLYWIPLHAIPQTINTGSAGTTTPILYYRKFSTDKFNNFIMNGPVPYEDEFVLYLDGTTKNMYVRTIANPSALNNRLLSTCPPASASSTCPADSVVASFVSSVAMRYFSRTGTLLDYTSSTDPLTGNYNGPDFPVVEVLEMTLTLKANPAFELPNATQNTTVIRVALRNN